MTGIDEVARLAGVSTATVSRALSGNGPVSPATRERVRSAADSLGYVVSSNASSLASGRTRNVGVVVPFLSRWFFSSIVEGAEAALARKGYDLTLYNLGGGDELRRSVFEHFLLRKRVDAVIAVALELTDDEVSRLLAIHKPIVGIGGPIPGVRTLTLDDLSVARLATEHLISLGHTRIAHVGGSVEFDLDFHLASTRRRGFERAMHEAQLPIRDDLYQAADFTINGGYAAGKQLLGRPYDRPTAIFAASDEMAIGCLLAARDLGLTVPHDVSIVGIDDHELSDFFDLTTVAQFPKQQGETAVAVLMDELMPDSGAHDSLTTRLPYQLIVRSSTARPAE
jgi:DNA-binding LacI/PurR family transcriptional regulator